MKSLWCRCGSNWDNVREWQEPLQLQDMGRRRTPGILDCDKLICVVPMQDSWVCVGIHLKHQVIEWYDSLLVSAASTSYTSLCILCKPAQACLSINFPWQVRKGHICRVFTPCMLMLSGCSVYAILTSSRFCSIDLLQQYLLCAAARQWWWGRRQFSQLGATWLWADTGPFRMGGQVSVCWCSISGKVDCMQIQSDGHDDLLPNIQSCSGLQESNGHGTASRNQLLWLWGVCFDVCRVCIKGCCDWLHLGACRCFKNQADFWHHIEKDSHSLHIMTVTCLLSIKCHQKLSITPVLHWPWCGLCATDPALLVLC